MAIARRLYVKASDIEEFGYTRGCPKCDHALEYGPGRTSKPYSKRCWDRIMGELAKTAAGQARIAAASERLDKTVAD